MSSGVSTDAESRRIVQTKGIRLELEFDVEN